MFCSNCGKTVGENDTSCPHCHIKLGDIRFEGVQYTSVQFRIVPGTPAPVDEAYAYTRMDYLVDPDTSEPVEEEIYGDEPETATVYRPTLRATEAAATSYEETIDPKTMEETKGGQQEKAPEADGDEIAVDPEMLTEEEVYSTLEDLKDRGAVDYESITEHTDEYVEEPIYVNDLEKSITEITEEQIAEQEKKAAKAAARRARMPKLPFLKKKDSYEALDDADEGYGNEEVRPDTDGYSEDGYAEPVEEYTGEEDPQQDVPYDGEEQPYEEGQYDENGEPYEDYGGESRFSIGEFMNREIAGNIRVATIAKAVGGVIAAVVVLILALKWFGFVSNQQQKAAINGVTLSLYNSGIELIDSYASDSNVSELLSIYQNDGIVSFTAKISEETAAINALMPAEPSVNDQLFIDTLLSIDTNIANAATLDGMTGSGTAESQQRWQVVKDAVASLKAATDPAQLQAIINGEKINVVSETPAPANTTAPGYTTLTKGDQGDSVRALQQRLYDLGYMTDAPDGAYGNKTTTAVKYFQMGADLNVTGIADSTTQELLYSDKALNVTDAQAAYQARQNAAQATAEPAQ